MRKSFIQRLVGLAILAALVVLALPALPKNKTAATILGYWDISGKFGVHPHGKVAFVNYREMFALNPNGTCTTLFGLPGTWKLSGSKLTITIDPFSARDFLNIEASAEGMSATNVSNFVLSATYSNNKISNGKITGTVYITNLKKGKRNQPYSMDGKFSGVHGQPFPTPTPTPIPTPTPTPIVIIVNPTPTPKPTPTPTPVVKPGSLKLAPQPALTSEERFADNLLHDLPGAVDAK